MGQDEYSRVYRPVSVLVDMGLAVVPKTGIHSVSQYSQRNCATEVARPAYGRHRRRSDRLVRAND